MSPFSWRISSTLTSFVWANSHRVLAGSTFAYEKSENDSLTSDNPIIPRPPTPQFLGFMVVWMYFVHFVYCLLNHFQAYAISAIAHWDWPEAWPDLFGHLMQALTSGDGNLVHGAMRVLTGTNSFSSKMCTGYIMHGWYSRSFRARPRVSDYCIPVKTKLNMPLHLLTLF